MADAYSQSPLLAKDLGLRAQARILEDFRDNPLYPQ
jgi:hypothetical protein